MTHAYVHTDWQVDNLKLTPHLIMDVVGEVDPGEIRVLARQVAMARKGGTTSRSLVMVRF